MRAATTKIPHLLNEKDLLKTLDVMYDFIYNFWFIYNELCMMGMGEKPRNVQKAKDKEKFPVWLPSQSPVYENGGRLFSDVGKNRKQAGPTLGGTGALV